MNQRPLFVAATGFVLGEVCALLAEGGINDLRAESVRYLLFGVLASGALLFGILDSLQKIKKRAEVCMENGGYFCFYAFFSPVMDG